MPPNRMNPIMRPRSIQLFEKALFAALAINLVSTVINWGSITAIVGDPRLAGLELGHGFVLATVVLSFVIYLVLWWFIARRASVVAKWLFVALTALGVLNFVQVLADSELIVGMVPLLGMVVLVLQVYAAWLLFRPDATAWLERGGSDPGPPGPIA